MQTRRHERRSESWGRQSRMKRRRSSERESKVRGSRAVMVGREDAKLGGDEEEEDEGEEEAEVGGEACNAQKKIKDQNDRLLPLVFYF